MDAIEEAVARYFIIVLFAVAAIGITFIRSVAEVLMTMSRERTRREIAAYVAGGAMSPEQGERLLAARQPRPPAST